MKWSIKSNRFLLLTVAFMVFIHLFLTGFSSGFSKNADSVQAEEISGYLHTDGNRILDSSGREVHFSGVNWFGFETGNNVVHGLWARNWEAILDDIKALGYNVIRLPFSNEMLTPGTMPDSIDYTKNPDLEGLSSIEIMDKIIEGAGERGLKVILDNHRSNAGASAQENGLWYTEEYPESRWISDWEFLTERYLGDDTVVAMDLRNEPHDAACWGCGDPQYDWKIAAEKAGNAVLSINPNLLILVEGNECYGPGGSTDPYEDGVECTWWGGNLLGAKDHPVELDVSNRLVYSPHDYPASVHEQDWFSDPDYPNNLPEVWDHFWGYLHNENTAPVLIGEFGTRMATDSDVQWFENLRDYIQEKELHWTFWSLNPNSGDTGGLYQHDWTTVIQEKQEILETIQYPLIGSGNGGSQGPTVPTGLTANAGDGEVLLSWNAVSEADAYRVKRSETAGGPYEVIASDVTETSYTDASVTNGTTYYYAVSAVNAEGESENSSEVSAVPQTGETSLDVALLYRDGDGGPANNQIKPHFTLVNQSQVDIPLSELTIRYWYTKDGDQSQEFHCDYAALGCGNISGSFSPADASDADTYLEVGFTSGAGTLAPGTDSGVIQLRINQADWSNYDETNDYSFDETKTSYTEWDRVTVYHNGSLIWGVAP